MNTSSTARRGRLAAGLGVVALGLTGALVATAPAQAADEPRDVVASSGDLSWGFRDAFRRYVGNQTGALPPVGALPVGQRITVEAPATFDLDGVPAVPTSTATPNETLPFLFPVTGGSVVDPQDVSIDTAGAAVFHFPSHAFTVTVQDVGVRVVDGVGTLVGDLSVVVPENSIGQAPGAYGGEDVVLGTIATTTVDVAGDSVTVSGDGVALTAEGASALQGFLGSGAELDDFTLTADLAAAGPVTPTFDPQIAVSATTDLVPGQTITVQGSGFDPTALTGARPPFAGKPSGVYVVFGKFADVWQPSTGALSAVRKVIDQKWALPEPTYSTVAGTNSQYVPLAADGTFTTTLTVGTSDAEGTYGVYVFPGSGASSAAHELEVPVTVAGQGEGDVTVGVTVPEAPVVEPDGELTWTISGSKAVSLGTASAADGRFVAAGALTAVSVTDTRKGQPAFTLSGSVSDFVGGARTFDGAHLGWTPSVADNTVGAVAGAAVTPGTGAGLSVPSTLVSAPLGHVKGNVTAGAELRLSLPLDTPAGDYTGVLTLTAVG